MNLPICNIHGKKTLKRKDMDIFLCRICLLKSKSDITYYYDNYDSFESVNNNNKLNSIINGNEKEIIKDYEGFTILNKVFLNIIKNSNIEFTNELNNSQINRKRFSKNLKDGAEFIYLNLIKKFEENIDELNNLLDNMDISLDCSKYKIQEVEKKLNSKLEFLSKEDILKSEFNKLYNSFYNKLKTISKNDFISENTNLNFLKVLVNPIFNNGSNIIISQKRNNGSYWSVSSENILEGEFCAKIRINKILNKSDWSLNIGIIRSNSTNTSTYYTDGVFFMCSGKITQQFSGNQGQNFLRPWKNDDIILIRRDKSNSIYFGLNDESTFEKAYSNIIGPYRICVGFSSSMEGDNIELLELD